MALNRKKKQSLPMSAKIYYGSGSLGYTVVQQTCNGILFYFGTVAHNVWPILMGLATSLGTIWDAITDPIVGHVSDRTDSVLFGKRHGYMLLAMFFIALFNIVLWAVPYDFPVVGKFFWFFLGIVVLELGNTFFQTPYHALGVELCGDYNERTVVQSFKTIFSLIGMMVPTVMMAIILTDRKNIQQYMTLSYIGSIFILIFGSLAILGTFNQLPRLRAKQKLNELNAENEKKEKGVLIDQPEQEARTAFKELSDTDTEDNERDKDIAARSKTANTSEENERAYEGSETIESDNTLGKNADGDGNRFKALVRGFTAILKDFFFALKERNFRSLILGYAISLMAAAFITTAGLHFLNYTFGLSMNLVASLLGVLLMMAVVSQLLWTYLSKKIDKKPTLIVGMFVEIVGVAVMAVVFVLYHYFGMLQKPFIFLLLAMTIIGTGVGVMFSMPASMLGDILTIQNQTGNNKTGSYNAFLTFSYKVSQGFSLFVIGVLLQIVGFNSEKEVQLPFVEAALGWIIIIGVTIVLSVGVFFYSKYNIKRSSIPTEVEPSHRLDE